MAEFTREQKYWLATKQYANFTQSALIAAGWTPRALPTVPKLIKPYTTLLAEIRAGQRTHNQSTWGPEKTPPKTVCGTAMCTVGHLVNMAGDAGWTLKKQFGFATAASLIHLEAHPDWPCQDFGSIPQDWAMAYIETMAEREAGDPSGGLLRPVDTKAA